MTKKKVLFLIHMPPPVHGASMMGLFTKNNSQVKKYFESKFINISSSKYLKNIGIFSLSKLMTTLKIVFKSTITIIFWKPDLIYFTPAPGKIALLKDGLICMIINILQEYLLILLMVLCGLVLQINLCQRVH